MHLRVLWMCVGLMLGKLFVFNAVVGYIAFAAVLLMLFVNEWVEGR